MFGMITDKSSEVQAVKPTLRFRAFSFNSSTFVFLCDACEVVSGPDVIEKALLSIELTLRSSPVQAEFKAEKKLSSYIPKLLHPLLPLLLSNTGRPENQLSCLGALG